MQYTCQCVSLTTELLTNCTTKCVKFHLNRKGITNYVDEKESFKENTSKIPKVAEFCDGGRTKVNKLKVNF